MCHGRHGAESRILFVTVSLVIAKILLLFFVWKDVFSFSGPTLPFSSIALCNALQNCSLLKLRPLSPVKNLRGDILKHRTRMKDEALEEGDFLVSAVQVLSLA